MIRSWECRDTRPCWFRKKVYGTYQCAILESTYEGNTCPFAKPNLNKLSYSVLELRRQKKLEEEKDRKERRLKIDV